MTAMQRFPLIALLLCATSGSAAIADAQQQTPRGRDAEEEAQDRQPPGWLFTPSFGFGGSWDDNVLLANPGSDPLQAYGTPLDSTLSLDYRGRKLSLSSGYTGSLVTYPTVHELDSTDHRVRAMMEYRATPRITLLADEYFIQAPSTDELNLAGVPFFRTGSRTNEGGGGVEAVVAQHTTLLGKYALRSVTFDQRAGQNLQDGYEHEFTLDAGTRTLATAHDRGAIRAAARSTCPGVMDRFNIQSGGVSIAYDVTRTITLSGVLGVARLGAGLTHDARTGPAVTVELSHRARETRMSASYQRTFVPSYGFGGTFQNEEWMGSAHVPVGTSRLYVEGTVAWFDNDPLESGQPSLQSLWLSTTLGYRAFRWLDLEAYGERTQQDTQRPGGDLRRNQAGFRVVVTKPMRIR